MIEHEQEFEVYHCLESLCSQKVRVAFAEKGLDYKSHVIELADYKTDGNNLSPEYLAVNPKGIVPTLVHNGVPVYDSYTIIEHVDDAYPGTGERLWPDSPADRARLGEWLHEASLRQDEPLGSTMGTATAGLSLPFLSYFLQLQPLPLVVRKYLDHPLKERAFAFIMARVEGPPDFLLDNSIVSMARGLARLDRELARAGSEWLFGDFCQLDVTFMAIFHRLDDIRVLSVLDHDGLSHVGDYARRLMARPSYQSAIVDFHDPFVREGMEKVYAGGNPSLGKLEEAIGSAVAQT